MRYTSKGPTEPTITDAAQAFLEILGQRGDIQSLSVGEVRRKPTIVVRLKEHDAALEKRFPTFCGFPVQYQIVESAKFLSGKTLAGVVAPTEGKKLAASCREKITDSDWELLRALTPGKTLEFIVILEKVVPEAEDSLRKVLAAHRLPLRGKPNILGSIPINLNREAAEEVVALEGVKGLIFNRTVKLIN